MYFESDYPLIIVTWDSWMCQFEDHLLQYYGLN
jgi:hypothetical protein